MGASTIARGVVAPGPGMGMSRGARSRRNRNGPAFLGLGSLDGVERIVAVDAETTGQAVGSLYGGRGGTPLPGLVIQLGCVEILRDGEGWRTGEEWESLVNPGAAISPSSREIHGIRFRDLAHAPDFGEVRPDFEAFVGGSPLLAHDADNEIAFLNHEMRRLGLAGDGPPYHRGRFLDTQRIGSEAMDREGIGLDRLCDLLWIDRKARFAGHGARLDAALAAEVFIALAKGGAPETRMLAEEPAPVAGGAMAVAMMAALRHRAK